MSKLVLAARDGFLDSFALAAAIPVAMLVGLWKVFKSFLGVRKKVVQR